MPAGVYTHERATNIGPCRIAFRDVLSSAWLHFTKMENVELRRETEEAVAREVIQNVKRDMRRVQTDMRVILKGDVMESVNPNVLEMIFGDGHSLTTFTVADTLSQTIEVMHLMAEKAIPVFHNSVMAAALPPPTAGVIALQGAGSTLTQAAHYVWITASYDGDDDHHSPPLVPNPTNLVVGVGQENILVTWTAPATGNPDHYTIWESQVNDVDTAKVCGTTNSVSYLITEDAVGVLYTATDINVMTVTSYDGVTPYVLNTDYTYNETLGTIARMSTGAIADGEPCLITYHYHSRIHSETHIGPGRMEVRTGQLRLHQLAGVEDADGVNTEETGLMIDLWKVDLLGGSVDWAFTEDEFFTGVSVELECLVSPTTNTFGMVYGFDETMAGWTEIADVLSA